MSGSLWAIVFDPAARFLCARIPRGVATHAVFADDVGTATNDAFQTLHTSLSVLATVAKGWGLNIHQKKTSLIFLGNISDEEILLGLQAVGLASRTWTFVRSWRYLGLILGLDGNLQSWAAPMA
eukprot:1420808-Pyramimonas_sp.AAC.1